MITNHDRDGMKKDIESIILDNITYVEIWTPKPMNEQPGYNPLLEEISDVTTVLYNKLLMVPADIVDMPGVQLVVDSPGGRKHMGQCFVHFPLNYKYGGGIIDVIVTDDSIIHMQNGPLVEEWRPKSIKYNRTGETIVQVIRV